MAYRVLSLASSPMLLTRRLHALRPIAALAPAQAAARMPYLVAPVMKRSVSLPTRPSSFLADSTGVVTYSVTQSWFHWLVAAGVGVIVGTVKLAQNSTKEQLKSWGVTKRRLMDLHKSTAVLMTVIIAPRVVMRLFSFVPPSPPGPVLQHLAASATHLLMYGSLVALPTSGILFSYYGGRGIPFFGRTIPGAPEDKVDKAFARKMFGMHKLWGSVLSYLLPLHISATLFHAFKGQNLLARFRMF